MSMRIFATVFISLSITFAFGQNDHWNSRMNDSSENKTLQYHHSVGASFFMLGNFLEESPDYYLLTYAYRLSLKDRIFAEFNTWKYAEPLGTYGNSERYYPGFIRAYGLGIGYQRLHWKGLFTTVQATSFIKQYHDAQNVKIQKGFQLYVQFAAGYRFEFFNQRFYIEPAFALKYWPIDTNFPTDFESIEAGTPKHIFEPSLNFGFRL